MKSKQTNLAKYMNFSKKNKSINKGKYKSGVPDSFSNKYPNYLQSSLNDDIFLIKKKIKGYTKIHSHSNSNTNKNIEINKNINKMPITSYINSVSPANSYLAKKKKSNDNSYMNKSLKQHIMLTSVNNSSIIYSPKDKDKDKGISFSNNNAHNISNYESNNYNNMNNNLYINVNKRTSLKNGNANNSFQKKNSSENEVSNQKNINNSNINNHIQSNQLNKKYSLTSINSKKNSTEKEKERGKDRENEEKDIIKKLNKLNFNGLFNNYNNNKRMIHSSKISKNSSNNSNLIIYNNNNNNNTSFNNINNNNSTKNNTNKNYKNLFIKDFFNLKKKGKYVNNFLESYLKAPQSSNNRKTKKDMNIINSNSNIQFKVLNNSNHNNANSITNNTISQNNNFSSSYYSPINKNKFYKTAKISPRSSFPKNNQDIIQSHRINVKNKLSENTLSFYSKYKNNNNIKYNMNNGSLYGINYNLESKINNYQNNKMRSKLNKKSKKNHMSVNMNITYNNKNFDMSNFKLSSTNKNKSSNGNNFNKSSSLNKIKKNSIITNYNNFNYNNNNNKKNNSNINKNNSFIQKNPINSSLVLNNNNQVMNGNNIINNCEININNINYNNYNPNIVQNSNNSNNKISEKIYNLFNNKNLLDMPSTKINKIISYGKKNFSSNVSPINKNIINYNEIKMKNKNLNNNKINYSTKIDKKLLMNYYNNSHNNNSSQSNININTNSNIKMYINKNSSNKSNQIKKMLLKKNDKNSNSKDNIIIKDLLIEEKDKNKDKDNDNDTDNNKNLYKKETKNKKEEYNYNYNSKKENKNKENDSMEIMELKHNLLKNKSENEIISKKNTNEKKSCDNRNNPNTITNMSSTTHDSNYYMEKCNSLSKYIKNYYKKYNKYPNTDLNFYLYGRLIGQGAFGKVNIGLNILTGRVVAIKSFNKKNLNKNGDNMKKILYETNLMKKLNHPNITKILEMFEDDEYILIAMEYINGGNLFSFVKKRRKLSEKTARFLFRQIILGIKHIHSQKIVHRDIKLENILIDLNNNIKICDFGIGRILNSKNQMLHDKCGTPMYMAPEILLSSKTKGYEGFPVDIWSAGISLYIMLSGTLPFNLKNNESSSIDSSNNNNIELQYSIIKKEPKKIEKISDEARDLLKGLLNKNPHKRLTIDQILNHPWLKSDEKIIKNNKKYHLFTKAEMIMLSKTYIDYRNGLIDDLKENFTLSNLKMEKNSKNGENKVKNITTKSSLLAPYNTLIQDYESITDFEMEDSFDDLINPNIILENDAAVFNNKVKEFNLNYELNNNGECDNGMLINTKTGTISSSLANNSSSRIEGLLTNRSRQRNENDENNDFDDDIIDNEEPEEEHEKKIALILDEIEKIGYDKEYVLNCVNNNILCHCSAVFYIMLNYKNV